LKEDPFVGTFWAVRSYTLQESDILRKLFDFYMFPPTNVIYEYSNTKGSMNDTFLGFALDQLNELPQKELSQSWGPQEVKDAVTKMIQSSMDLYVDPSHNDDYRRSCDAHSDNAEKKQSKYFKLIGQKKMTKILSMSRDFHTPEENDIIGEAYCACIIDTNARIMEKEGNELVLQSALYRLREQSPDYWWTKRNLDRSIEEEDTLARYSYFSNKEEDTEEKGEGDFIDQHNGEAIEKRAEYLKRYVYTN
jgi:hypothetical protein